MTDDVSKYLPRDLPTVPSPEVLRASEFASKLGREAEVVLGSAGQRARLRLPRGLSPELSSKLAEAAKVGRMVAEASEAVRASTAAQRKIAALAEGVDVVRPSGAPLGPVVKRIERDFAPLDAPSREVTDRLDTLVDAVQVQNGIWSELLTDRQWQIREARFSRAMSAGALVVAVAAWVTDLGGGLKISAAMLVIGLVFAALVTWRRPRQ